MTPAEYEEFVLKHVTEMWETNKYLPPPGTPTHKRFGAIRIERGRKFDMRSGAPLNTDVSVEASFYNSSVLFIYECKHYSDLVGVDILRQFAYELNDVIGYRPKGIVVTTVGLQSGALEVAKSLGIGLILLCPKSNEPEMKIFLESETSEPPWDDSMVTEGRLTFPSGTCLRFDSASELLTALARWENG